MFLKAWQFYKTSKSPFRIHCLRALQSSV